MTDHSTLADLERAVEEAWEGMAQGTGPFPVTDAINAWLAARRAAREAGMVSVLVSREALLAISAVTLACLASSTRRVSCDPGSALDRMMTLLARDLAAALKPDGE